MSIELAKMVYDAGQVSLKAASLSDSRQVEISHGEGPKSVPAAVQTFSAQQVEESIKKLNHMVQNYHRSIEFTVDQSTNELIVKVYNLDTGELIRQIPEEQTVKLALHFDQMIGMILDDKM